ncbi:immunoglobulin domain-containing protein [Pedobacter sp. AW1-32]|uniref:immunoglobulin domain-containing protein n=1 Tax=Pedobacter sp. AW1-32 TaxID=3383026 RepID=UPI003FEECF29
MTTNDIDWIFYDLGINGDCNMINATNAIRCAADSGVTCSPSYYKTGLSLTETELTESSGCPFGQNGFVKYVDLIEGHIYALLIDNFSSGNNAFTIEFGGSAEFAGPSAEILVEKLNPCTDAQAYIFKTEAKNYADLKWSFGENASLSSATTEGPFTVTYSSPGEKVIVLEATASNGCKVITTQTFMVGNTPAKPNISASESNLCQGDVFLLETPPLDYATYHWTGPNGFSSNERNPSFSITGNENIGVYSLFVQVGTCVSEINTFEVLSVDLKPNASFSIVVNNKCESNQSFSFENASTNYSKISWDFGPTVASHSNLANDGQLISFNNPGLKTITLTVESKNGCTSTMTQNLLVEVKADQPTIQINQPLFCLKDVIKMSVPELAGVTYAWTGPNNFTATTSSVEIPVLSQTQAGLYTVILTSGSCVTDPATITIQPMRRYP